MTNPSVVVQNVMLYRQMHMLYLIFGDILFLVDGGGNMTRDELLISH